MARPKGQPKLGGRKKGTPNKFTRSAKEAYAHVFEELGGADGLLEWAKSDPANRRDFYSWHTKLLPIEHAGKIDLSSIPTLTDDELDAQAKALGLK